MLREIRYIASLVLSTAWIAAAEVEVVVEEQQQQQRGGIFFKPDANTTGPPYTYCDPDCQKQASSSSW